MDKKEFIELLDTYTDGDSAYDSLMNQREFFRLNTLKTNLEDFLRYSELSFEKSGLWEYALEYKDSIPIGRTWEYFLGYIHPQSFSSMLPPIVLNPGGRDFVLDLTAAPGGKTTQLAAMMRNKGLIVANDTEERILSLFSNIKRLGVLNTVVSEVDAKNWRVRSRFNKVLVDAPCSALTGEKAAHRRYVPLTSKNLSRVQKVLLLRGFDSLKVGGELVYSTCTIIEEENESVVNFLLERRPEAELVPIKLDLKHDKGISMKEAVRVYPQHFQSEGFFIAKIRKTEEL